MIDGHAHSCGSLMTADGIRTYLERNHIERIILCGGEAGSKHNYRYPLLSDVIKEDRVDRFVNGMIATAIRIAGFANHFDEENERVWQLRQELPEQVWNAYWANPLEEDCLDKMEQFYREKGFVMVKLHQCWTDFDIDSEVAGRIFAWAGEKNLPVFIHLKNYKQAMAFAKAANKYRSTKFVVAHLLWSGAMAAVLTEKNVWFDLSSPQLYSLSTLQFALEHYGVGRLILGSDMPYGTRNTQLILKRMDQLEISVACREQIVKGNILNIIPLDG